MGQAISAFCVSTTAIVSLSLRAQWPVRSRHQQVFRRKPRNFDVAVPAGAKEAWLNLGCRKLATPDLGLPLCCGEIVNSNLEVKTAVRIAPKTGAAATGALCTYARLSHRDQHIYSTAQ
ncbi:MAG: hypothetical protein IJU76_06710 [Desulfovibrionaceae bacterium]|nr:hypothetical protein [Desulfovibrionaceae bacterium]